MGHNLSSMPSAACPTHGNTPHRRPEAEIRQVAAKLAHRPVAEIMAVLRERNIAADPAFVATLTKGK